MTTTLGYDDIGQILSETDSGGYAASYTYDANGNRLTKTTGGVTQTYATDSGDKLTGITYSDSTLAKNFTYHFSGRCTGFTQGTITRTYAWDKECRITGVSETGQASVSYGYNGFEARATRAFGGATTTTRGLVETRSRTSLASGSPNPLWTMKEVGGADARSIPTTTRSWSPDDFVFVHKSVVDLNHCAARS